MAGGINALARTLGKVDANNALVVALDGSSPLSATRFIAAVSTEAAPAFTSSVDLTSGLVVDTNSVIVSVGGVAAGGGFRTGGVSYLYSTSVLSIGSNLDVLLVRAAAKTLKIGSLTAGAILRTSTDDLVEIRNFANTAAGNLDIGYLQGLEITAPAAPAANGFRLFAQDNGAGKTQLMVLFATGAAQQVAIEP